MSVRAASAIEEIVSPRNQATGEPRDVTYKP
jgi:hypothetical protein